MAVRCLVVTVVWSLVASAVPARSPGQSAVSLYDRYASGEYEVVFRELQARLTSSREVVAFLSELKGQIRRWPRHTAAAFALEASAAAFLVDGRSAFQVLELGCDRLREVKPTPWELDWQIAAMALTLEPPSPDTLAQPIRTAPPDPLLSNNDLPNGRGFDAEHDRHLRVRFPREPHLVLADGLHRESLLYSYLQVGMLVLTSPVHSDLAYGPTTWRLGPGFDVKVLAAPFQDLLTSSDASLRAEAMLHLGFVRNSQQQYDEALGLWARARTESPDQAVQYLALLFRARTLWSLPGKGADAIAALDEALTIRPGAHAASMSLAALYFLSQQPERAAAVIEAQLAADPETDDPWRSYLRSASLKWPVWLQVVRRSLK
jgi:tetratricopeptide (TPR) repeat protein